MPHLGTEIEIGIEMIEIEIGDERWRGRGKRKGREEIM